MLAAILFDLDGTLANTDSIHFAVWQDILTRFDLEIDHKFYQEHISGQTNAKIIKEILPQLSLQEAWHLAIEKQQRSRQLVGTLQPMPGLQRLLTYIENYSIKQAIVTNGSLDNTLHILKSLRLNDVFTTVIVAEDAPPGKPDPAPYELGLNRLGVQAKNTIVFEDTPAGITSAVSAGIKTIGVTSTHTPENLTLAGASMVIEDFNSQQLWEFLEKKMFY